MLWKRKKESMLPELPPFRSPPESKEEDMFPEPLRRRLPELPEFSEVGMENEIRPKSVEMEEWNPEEDSNMVPEHYSIEKKQNQKHYHRETTKSEIFVKVDKFRAARKDLESAKEKLEDIDHLLRRIRETKMREDQELSAWEKEVATIKSRLQNITNNIFEKIE